MRMNRVLPMALITLLRVVPTAHAARGFSLGVAAGEVTSKSAVLWAKAKKSGKYTLRVARNKGFTRGLVTTVVRARKSHDNDINGVALTDNGNPCSVVLNHQN